MSNMAEIPNSYEKADGLLQGRCKFRRKVANNTYLERRDHGIGLLLHSTDVVTFYPNGDMKLDSGGWRTVTTKDRINQALSGWRLWQENGQWTIARHNGNGYKDVAVYADGMILEASGETEGGEPLDVIKEKLELRRRVQRYAAAYLKAFEAGKVPVPSAGDSWHCVMRTDAGETLGETFKNTSHLLSHISKEERYFVPSLLVRAMEVMPVSQAMQWSLASQWGETEEQKESGRAWWSNWTRRSLQKTLSRYILRQLGQAS